MASTCSFTPFHSSIVVLKNCLVLHLSGLNVGFNFLPACFGGKFLNRKFARRRAVRPPPRPPRRPWRALAHLHSAMPVCYTSIWVTMQVHPGGDHSLACLDSTCAINYDSFVRRRSLNLLLKYSSETTRLSTGRSSGDKQCSSRTQLRALSAEYNIHALVLCTWQKHTKEGICEDGSEAVVVTNYEG